MKKTWKKPLAFALSLILLLALLPGGVLAAETASGTGTDALAEKTYYQSTAVIYNNDMSDIRWPIPSYIHFFDEENGFFHIELLNTGYVDTDFTYTVNGNTITLYANPDGIHGYTTFSSLADTVVLEKNGDKLTIESYSPRYNQYNQDCILGLATAGDVFTLSSDTPSAWAKEEIENAIRLDLIPSRWLCGYKTNITRGDFCSLAMTALCIFEGKYLYEIIDERGIEVDESVYSDTDNYAFHAGYAMGIGAGRGNGIFAPNDPITRQEAAVMLMQTAYCASYQPYLGDAIEYADANTIADWAAGAVSAVSRMIDNTNGQAVMGGVGSNKFSPNGYYTREQSYVSMIRLYHSLVGGKAITEDPSNIVASGECGAQGDNLTWVLYNNGLLMISGSGAMADYDLGVLAPWDPLLTNTPITSVRMAYGVTTIGECAFFDQGFKSSISSVIIPKSVTTIGGGAFFFCSNLVGVTIPNSVSFIQGTAFYLCGVTHVTIPSSVNFLDGYAFSGCGKLTGISVSASNPYYQDIDGVVFSKDATTLVRYPGGRSGVYSIPNSVTTIGPNAFNICRKLTGIDIPNSVATIGDCAFDMCTGLTSVTIPGSVTSFGFGAFENCDGLTSATILDGVTTIPSAAFSFCTSLTSITIPSSVTTIQGAFDNTALTDVYYSGTQAQWNNIIIDSYNDPLLSATKHCSDACLSITSVKANKTTANVGDAITWTAAASGGTGTLQYAFYVYKDGTVIKKTSYSTANSLTYKPTEAGAYQVRAYVKDGSGTARSLTGGAVTVSGSATPTPTPTGLAVTSIKANKTSAAPGETITWSVAASGGNGTIRYCFYVYKDGATIQKGSYSTAKTFSYTPTAAGTYSVKVFVKDGSGATANKTGGSVTVASSTPLAVASIKANKTSAAPGETITWTAAASGGSGTIKYCFYVYKDGATIQKGSYSTAKTFSYTPTAAGTYSVKVFVKDGSGATASKTGGSVTVASSTPLAVASIKANKPSAAPGDTITWTAAASGGNGTIRYCFYVYKDGATIQKGNYSTAKTFSYTPTAAGTYSVKVFVKDGSGATASKTGGSVTAASSTPLAVTSVKANKTEATIGDTITWSAAASGGNGSIRYCFYVYMNGTIVHKGSYGASKTFTYTPAQAGRYSVKVFVKDGAGASASKTGGVCSVILGTAEGAAEGTIP